MGRNGRNITHYFQSSISIANFEVSKETLVCKIVIVMKVDGYSLRRRGRPTTHQPDWRSLWTTKLLLWKLSTAIWEQPVGSADTKQSWIFHLVGSRQYSFTFQLECEVRIRKGVRVVYSTCAWKLTPYMLTEKVSFMNILNVHDPTVLFQPLFLKQWSILRVLSIHPDPYQRY